MRSVRVSGTLISLVLPSGTALCGSPQLPGTRAYTETRKAWDAIRDGHHEDAAAAFAVALDAEPRDPRRGSDIAGAIQVYESALKYAPDDKTLTGRLQWLRREAAVHAAWSRQQLVKEPARLPFSRLAGSFENLSGADARLAYARSAAQDRARGESFAAAFEQRFFQTCESFIANVDASH